MHHASVWILPCHCNFERISWSGTKQIFWWLDFNYCQWKTTDWAISTTFTATYEKYKEPLIDVIDDLTRQSYIAKLKINFAWCRTNSKGTTGVKNTASYIPWLYTTWDQMVASNMILCVLFFLWQQPLHKLFASSSNNACSLS